MAARACSLRNNRALQEAIEGDLNSHSCSQRCDTIRLDLDKGHTQEFDA